MWAPKSLHCTVYIVHATAWNSWKIVCENTFFYRLAPEISGNICFSEQHEFGGNKLCFQYLSNADGQNILEEFIRVLDGLRIVFWLKDSIFIYYSVQIWLWLNTKIQISSHAWILYSVLLWSQSQSQYWNNHSVISVAWKKKSIFHGHYDSSVKSWLLLICRYLEKCTRNTYQLNLIWFCQRKFI